MYQFNENKQSISTTTERTNKDEHIKTQKT